MNVRRSGAVLAATAAVLVVTAAPAHAEGPVIHSGGGQDTYFDDFIFDLCGIATFTTVTERWTLKVYSDGSETLHVVRSFDPEDPRVPDEKGAATSFNAADGSRRVVGKPLHLFHPDGGVQVIDAGSVTMTADGEPDVVRGPHPSLGMDEADLYCP